MQLQDLKIWSVVGSSHDKSPAWFQKWYCTFIYNLHSILGCRMSELFCALLYLFILAALAKGPDMFNNSSATNTSKRGRTFKLEVQEQQPCTWIDRQEENPIQHVWQELKSQFLRVQAVLAGSDLSEHNHIKMGSCQPSMVETEAPFSLPLEKQSHQERKKETVYSIS